MKDDTEFNSYGGCWALLGILPPRGQRQAVIEQWQSLSVVCALLTGVAASGMYVSGNYVHDFGLHHDEDDAPDDWGGMTTKAQHVVAQATMMLFCVDTFCFLNATVLSKFFVEMMTRETKLEVGEAHDRLGFVYHFPQVYFRLGFVLLVCSLCGFFVMVMEPWKMAGCLLLCLTLIIAPMTYGTTRALAITIPPEETLAKRATNMLEEVTGQDIDGDGRVGATGAQAV